MKEQTSTVEEHGGEKYRIDKATIQIGEGHLFSVILVDGVWLHYDITLLPGTQIKPGNVERYLIERLANAKKREEAEKARK